MKADPSYELDSRLARTIRTAQITAHYAHVPAIVVATCLGGLFCVWVLSGIVDDRLMYLGFGGVLLLSAIRYVVYRRFLAASAEQRGRRGWTLAAIAFSAASGALWGSAAILLYPPSDPRYAIFMVLLFALTSLAPIAALACYLPAFYAYYIPCALPFLVRLALQQDHVGLASAALLLMLMAAAITFARRYYRDFFEAVRLRAMVERQRDEVQTVSRSKSAFLAAASHDLRQPMHAIALFAEALAVDRGSAAAAANQRGLFEAVRALGSLLDRLLDLSQLDTGDIAVRKSCFDMDALLQKLGREFTPLAHQRALTLKVARTRRRVMSDMDLVENLLRNLISNALRYTNHGGVIVGCRWRGARVLVQVSDTGIGIDPAHRQRIFEEFFQVDNPARDRSKGLGLGLPVAARIARLLDTQVNVASIPRRGSTFTVALPQADTAPAEEPPRTDETALPAAKLQGCKILFVENDSSLRDSYCALANTWGCEAHTAASEAEAITLIDTLQFEPDVLILDYTLQRERTGVSVAQQIELRVGRRVPALIVTADMSDRPGREAAAAGYHLAHKPLPPGNLKALIVHLTAVADARG